MFIKYLATFFCVAQHKGDETKSEMQEIEVLTIFVIVSYTVKSPCSVVFKRF